MKRHTPGPWSVLGTDEVMVEGLASDICSLIGDRATQLANANLIAAAPDLAEALRVCVDALDTQNGIHHTYRAKVLANARAALAKAGLTP